MNSEKGLVGSTSIQAAIEIYTENQGRSNSHCYDVANGSKEGTTLVKNAQGNQHKRVDYIQQSITAGEILLKNSYSNTKKKSGGIRKTLVPSPFFKTEDTKTWLHVCSVHYILPDVDLLRLRCLPPPGCPAELCACCAWC